MNRLLAIVAIMLAAAPATAQERTAEEGSAEDDFAWMEQLPSAVDGPEWGELPDEIVPVLSAKAEAYRARALKFSCRERVRRFEYRDGAAGRERVREYDYLLIEDPLSPSGLSALRTYPDSQDTEGLNVDLPFPEPYFFSRIFDDAVRSTLRFRVGQWHTTPWRLAMPISWVSSAPVFGHDRVTEWSGTVEVEYRTGNIIRITAQPNLQEETLQAELERYLTAFNLLGFSTAPPPLGMSLTIDFGFEHEGFLYPTRVEVHTFRQVHRGVRATVSKLVAEYDEYRFFGTYVEEEVPPFLYQPPLEPLERDGPIRPSDELFENPFEDI